MQQIDVEGGMDDTPRPVSRGLNLQLRFLGLDSLYLIVEYPSRDLFDYWSTGASFKDTRLKTGIPYQEMVLRHGALGYPLSVWDGDARLFLTPRVNDELRGTPHDGQGMGCMLQLGPKWLRRFGDVIAVRTLRENVRSQLLVYGVEDPEQYRVRINRADITLDVLGLDVSGLNIAEWREGWVGMASRKHFYDSAWTGRLEGLAIGSSEGAVRFKVYDKVAETVQRGTSGFWRSVWGVGAEDDISVARFEWSVKCYAGRFVGMRYLSDVSYDSFLELLNYLTLRWGQLRVPQSNDQTKKRWPLAPLWGELRRMIDEWSFNCDGPAQRDYDFSIEINDHYLRSVVGWLAGLEVRVGLEQGKHRPATLTQVLRYLEKLGYPTEKIEQKASQKWKVMSRLAGGEK